MRADLAQPTMDEWLAGVAELPEHPALNLMGAQLIEEARDARCRPPRRGAVVSAP